MHAAAGHFAKLCCSWLIQGARTALAAKSATIYKLHSAFAHDGDARPCFGHLLLEPVAPSSRSHCRTEAAATCRNRRNTKGSGTQHKQAQTSRQSYEQAHTVPSPSLRAAAGCQPSHAKRQSSASKPPAKPSGRYAHAGPAQKVTIMCSNGAKRSCDRSQRSMPGPLIGLPSLHTAVHNSSKSVNVLNLK